MAILIIEGDEGEINSLTAYLDRRIWIHDVRCHKIFIAPGLVTEDYWQDFLTRLDGYIAITLEAARYEVHERDEFAPIPSLIEEQERAELKRLKRKYGS